jgi:RecB family endonuclease NucS
MEKESKVIKEVKEIIRLCNVKIQRINTGCFKVGERWIRTAQKGTLDFEGYDNKGRFVGIECKRPGGGRISEEQKERINDINKKGGLATVVTSGNEALDFLIKNKCF